MVIKTGQKIRDIQSLIEKAGNNIADAARIYAEETAKDPNFPTICREEAPWVSPKIWHGLESIQSGEMDWRVAFGVAPHAKLISKLPAKLQKEVLDKGVEISNGHDTMMIQVSLLDDKQAREVFKGGKLRSPQEQCASSFLTKPKTIKREVDKYEVTTKHCHIFSQCFLTRQEIIDIAKRMGVL
jgi:hypothetical protein